MKQNYKFSIITVVYNAKDALVKTVESIQSQSYRDFEHIIIDGASTDGTVEYIKSLNYDNLKYVSEKDNGIYDAMNKGIKISSGMWLNFMNAGDVFVDCDVLHTLEIEQYDQFALVYGNKIQNRKIVKPFNTNCLSLGVIMGNHQSMFFNKAILKDNLIYKLEYPIYADYELVNKIYREGYLLKYVDLNIADYEGGGISSYISSQKRKDKYKIVFESYGFFGLIKALFFRVFQYILGKKCL